MLQDIATYPVLVLKRKSRAITYVINSLQQPTVHQLKKDVQLCNPVRALQHIASRTLMALLMSRGSLGAATSTTSATGAASLQTNGREEYNSACKLSVLLRLQNFC